MNWNKSKSMILSLALVVFFGLLLLGVDIFAWPVCGVAADSFLTLAGDRMRLLVTLFLCSVFAWLCLYCLFRLLLNLWNGKVFTENNVGYLRATSWCCMAVAVICGVAAVWYCLPMLVIAGAAGFMGLIVRIVKNIFRQAIDMKNELDYTV